MKTHTIVGAEIVEQIQFPYPVAPIVRSHHEKWNGSGYPDGLSGEKIPIGARILSAVDCLDALASDRQYRRALPLEEAIKIVQEEAGKSFDPRVVEILVQPLCRVGAHGEVRQARPESEALHGDENRARRAPAAGFEVSNSGDLISLHNTLSAADQRIRVLDELSSQLEHAPDCPRPS